MSKQKESVYIVPKRTRYSIVDFLMMTTNEVLDCFAGLPDAQYVKGEGQKRYIYVPGKRKDKVLLVSHCDSVWDDGNAEMSIRFAPEFATFFTGNKNGINADDRAGCAMLWNLRKSGHSLFIPDGEESHGIGSSFAMENSDFRKIINEHTFAMEFDRMNAKDLATYGVGTKDFHKWLESKYKGYSVTHGAWTDICILCNPQLHKEDTLCGVNVSVGYYNQHSDQEILVLPQWQRTLSITSNILKEENLPSFKHRYYKPTYSSNNKYYNTNYSACGYNNGGVADEWSDHLYNKAVQNSKGIDEGLFSNIIICPNPKCEALTEIDTFIENQECEYCKTNFYN